MAQNTKADIGLHELECITDDPRYEGFAFVREDSIRGKERLSFDFMPDDIQTKGRAWTVTLLRSIWTPQPVEGRVLPFNDYPCVNMSIPAFSHRAVDVLYDFLEPNGELLPLVCSIGAYYVYNVTTVADVLDQSRSAIEWMDDKREIALNITRYECVPEKLDRLSIFRLVEKPASTFVTQVFVDRVREHELEGFRFVRLWPSKPPKGKDASRKQKPKRLEQTKSATCNTVVILLATSKSKPNKAEKDQLAKLMDEADGILYDPKSQRGSPYYGSLEGNDFSRGHARIFFSCPNANVLLEKLSPWLKTLNWNGRVSALKRYGEYDDPSCKEEIVELQ